MASLFGKGSIRKRVMEVMEQRITDGQEEFDREAKAEDDRLAEGIRALTDACTNAKLAAEHRIVNRITN